MLRSVFTLINVFFVLLLFSQTRLSPQGDVNASTPSLVNTLHSKGVKIYLSSSSYFYDVGEPVLLNILLVNAETLQPILYNLPCRLSIYNGRGQRVYSQVVDVGQGSNSMRFDTIYFRNGGEYKFRAECLVNGKMIGIYHNVIVQQTIQQNAFIEATTHKEQYVPGDSLEMTVNVKRSNGLLATKQALMLVEIYGDEPVDTFYLQTDDEGNGHFRTRINKAYDENKLVYLIKMDEGGLSESIVHRIPLNTGKINIITYLENGFYKVGKPCNMVLYTTNDNGDLIKASCLVYNLKTQDSFMVETNDYGFGRFAIPLGDSIHQFVVFSSSNRQYFYHLTTNTESMADLKIAQKNSHEIIYQLQSDTARNIRFVCHVRGKICLDTALSIGAISGFIKVPIAHLMPGVMQGIIFNQRNEILAQKLCFVNRQKKLKVESVWSDKVDEITKKRQLKLRVTDEKNQPVEGVFNMTITDEKNKILLEDKQSKISENLQFESDLKYPVKDIGKLWKNSNLNNDSLLDIFLNGCELNQQYLPKIIKRKKELAEYYYQFILEGSYYGSYNYKEIKQVVFKSEKGRYLAEVNQNSEIYVPIDSISFPCKIIIYGSVREVLYVDETYVKLALKTNKDLANHTSPTSFYTLNEQLPFINNTLLEVVEVPESNNSRDQSKQLLKRSLVKTGLRGFASLAGLSSGVTATPSGLSGRGSRTDATAYFIDGVRVFTNSSTTSCIISSKMLIRTGTRNYIPHVGLLGGVTATRNGFSNRGSRDDGTAIYVDWVRVITAYETNSPYLANLQFPGMSSNYWFVNTRRNYYNEPDPHRYSIRKYRPNGISLPRYQNYIYEYKHDLEEKKITTYHWETGMESNKNGEIIRQLKMPEKTMLYHVGLEGISTTGMCAEFDTTIGVLQDIYMTLKAPNSLLNTDTALIVCRIYNNTKSNKSFYLKVEMPDEEKTRFVKVDAGCNREIILPYSAAYEHILQVELKDADGDYSFQKIEQKINISEKLFRQNDMANLSDGNKHEWLMDGKAKKVITKLIVYPSKIENLNNKLLDMITMPHGCFEQVSSTNYPNILAYQYLSKNLGTADILNAGLLQKREYLINGYNQLANYETKTGGFSWYGDGSGNEALTALGLLQFNQLKKCNVPVSEALLDRSKKWLLSSRNKEGIFVQSPGRYGFANTSPEVAHAYITYVLNELGETNLDKSIEQIKVQLKGTPNLYNEALLFSIYLKQKDAIKAQAMYDQLSKKVADIIGKQKVQDPIITLVNSYYDAAINETLCIIANGIFNNHAEAYLPLANEIGIYIQSKNFYAIGNMQTKAMAIETMFHIMKSDPINNGNILNVKINNTIHQFEFSAYTTTSIDISEFIEKGKNGITVLSKYGSNLVVERNSSTYFEEALANSKDPDLSLEAVLSAKAVKVGDMLNFKISITNNSQQVLPQTVAVLHIPGGVNLNPEELLFLKKQGVIDFFEILNGEIILYFEEIDKGQKINFTLPLTCEVKGNYEAKACYIYKYYQSRFKTNGMVEKLIIE